MKISYAIPVCNEFEEIQKLLNWLVKNKRQEDEIVVLFDSTNGTSNVEEYLRAKSINGEFNWVPYAFNNDFSDMKNKLTSLCNGDWIYQIDADELPSKETMTLVPEIIESNPTVDVYRIPRINTVEHIDTYLGKIYVEQWGWRVDHLDNPDIHYTHKRINFPDYQWRLYKNNGKIKWKNKVHEVLTGFEYFGEFPTDDVFCLYHEKKLERQVAQVGRYQNLDDNVKEKI